MLIFHGFDENKDENVNRYAVREEKNGTSQKEVNNKQIFIMHYIVLKMS